VILRLAVLVELRLVTDRDRQTYRHIASRGKNQSPVQQQTLVRAASHVPICPLPKFLKHFQNVHVTQRITGDLHNMYAYMCDEIRKSAM